MPGYHRGITTPSGRSSTAIVLDSSGDNPAILPRPNLISGSSKHLRKGQKMRIASVLTVSAAIVTAMLAPTAAAFAGSTASSAVSIVADDTPWDTPWTTPHLTDDTPW